MFKRQLVCFLFTVSVVLQAGAPSDFKKHEFSTGVILNPAGIFGRYARKFWLSDVGLYAAIFDQFLVFSNEFGVELTFQTPEKWLVSTFAASFEPGWFRKIPPGQAMATGRSLGWRSLVRGQVTLNLEYRWLRLYSRSTAQYRYRNFLEDDAFQKIQIREERFFEQATALMIPVIRSQSSQPPYLFRAYLEYTVGVLQGFGTRPNRISIGLISEDWLRKDLVMNLDLFYSMAAAPIDGPGAIFLLWYYWE